MHFGVIQSLAFPMISFIARHFLMEKCPFVFLELLGMESRKDNRRCEAYLTYTIPTSMFSQLLQNI